MNHNTTSLLINILNTMYNDNTRQIQLLNQSNSEIMNTFSSILLASTRNTNNNNNNTNPNISRNRHPNPNISRNRHPNPNISRNRNYNLGTTPYFIDNVDNYYTYNNNNNNTISPILNRPNSVSNSRNVIRENRNILQESNTRFSRFFDSFLEPINIFPTATQIEIATRNIRFGEIIEPINNSCPISLETFNENDNVTMIRHCGHIFNTIPLSVWFRTNCKCPICRYDIRNYNSLTTTTTMSNIPSGNSIERNVDVSGNLIDSITDTVLHELINSNSVNDSSNNNVEQELATFYFAFPSRY